MLIRENTDMKTNQHQIELLHEKAPYYSNSTQIFYELCGLRPATLLLESTAINNKKKLKSIMLIDSALRITAFGKNVILKSMNNNGDALLPLLDLNLPKEVKINILPDGRKITFPHEKNFLDEDSRLRALSIFDCLRIMMKLVNYPEKIPSAMFFGGLFSYDLVSNFESLPTLKKEIDCPDYCFYLAETLAIFDHQKKTCSLQSTLFKKNKKEKYRLKNRLKKLQFQLHHISKTIPFKTIKKMQLTCNKDDEQYAQIVKKIQKKIKTGEVFQVVLSRKFSLPCTSPIAAYHVLKKNNPSPYMFFMQDEKFTLFGTSPESALKYDETTRQIEIYPIAGTRARGFCTDGSIDADLDSRIELEMRFDHKELAEHLMLVDLARNDLARICEPGSRYVMELTKVDRYSFVMHLVSRVIGKLKHDLDIFHAYRACMNMGTLSGAPKIRAMQIISEFEGECRGAYGGAIGYFTSSGILDTSIIIRSAYVQNGVANVQAGAGIVLDSIPELEAQESRNKALAVLNAIIDAHSSKELFYG